MKQGLLVKYSIILSIIPSVFVFFFPGKVTAISVLCTYPLMILLLFYTLEIMPKKSIEGKIFIDLFILLNIIILLRGFINAQSSADWKHLFFSVIPLSIFLPLTIYFGMNLNSLKISLITFLKYVILPASIFLLAEDPSLLSTSYGKTVAPICLLIIFAPYLTMKWKIFVFAIGTVSFFSDIDNRSNMINLFVALLISLTFYFRNNFLTLSFIRFSRIIMILFPIVFTLLGVFNIFNIFRISELVGKVELTSSDGETQDVMVDSRTGIYTDVLSELNDKNAILWGLGGSGKTPTHLTLVEHMDFDIIYKEGRRSTESGMLNFAQYGGVLGVVLYFLLFIKASDLAINKSKNWLCIMIGLWVAYKGVYSFVEDRLQFNLSSIFIFIALGLCFNKSLRMLSNSQIEVFVRSIFDKKYNKYMVLNEE